VVVTVSYDKLTNTVDSHASKAIELPFSVAVATELLQEGAIRVKHLQQTIFCFVSSKLFSPMPFSDPIGGRVVGEHIKDEFPLKN